MQKDEIRPLPYSTHKNLKWVKDLNLRPETKTSTSKIWRKLPDSGICNDFLDVIPEVQVAKTKI